MFQATDKAFMNYWNLRQVIYLEGTLDLSMTLEFIFSKIQDLDIIPKFSLSGLGKLHILSIEDEQCKKWHDILDHNNEHFHELLN